MFDIKNIKDPSFIKNLTIKEKKELANDLRTFLIENISKTGGHLGSNLGIVEIMIALYTVFDYENDSFLFDVGHQAYIHKIFTGRADKFDSLRKFNGLSGYINRNESKYDIWESGHSSTSISALAGMLLAEGKNTKKHLIAIIGDASIVNGVSLEALNYLGSIKGYHPIIILNDNKMGISKSVGSLNKVFNRLRSKKFLIKLKRFCNNIFPKFIANGFHKIKRGIKGLIQKDNIFEDLGFDYYGPVDGNNIKALTNIFNRIKDLDEPVIIHTITKKGKGYEFAEKDDFGSFHGVSPFDINTGKPLKEKEENVHSYSYVVSYSLTKLREKTEFYVITPAMKVGAELEIFAEKYKDSFIDVGIAEEHAAVMSAGLTLGGKKAVLLMYSTFAQRAYDFFLNDICRQDLPVIIGLDRAGVVGADGQTHAGIYDVSMFAGMPNCYILMPRNPYEVIGLFSHALSFNHPVVIRYPRLDVKFDLTKLEICDTPFKWDIVRQGNNGIVLVYGHYVDKVLNLVNANNLDLTVVNARLIKPLDYECLDYLKSLNQNFLVIEEVISNGSLYEALLVEGIRNIKGLNFDVNIKLPHGSIKEVLDSCGFSDDDILKLLKELNETR